MAPVDSLNATFDGDDDWFLNSAEMSPQERLHRLADAFEAEPDRADRLVQALANSNHDRGSHASVGEPPENSRESAGREGRKWPTPGWAFTAMAAAICLGGALIVAFAPARVPSRATPGSIANAGPVAAREPGAPTNEASDSKPAQQPQLAETSQRRRPDSAIDLDTVKNAAVAAMPSETASASPVLSAVDSQTTRPQPPRLKLSTSRGQHPSYRVGETLSFAVVPNSDSYVYCFYRDAKGAVARIFPNRFHPDPFVGAGTQVEIPSAGGQSFEIRLDPPGGTESVACIAADRELGPRLPDSFMAHDLEPLHVSGLDEVSAWLGLVSGGEIDDERLVVNVSP